MILPARNLGSAIPPSLTYKVPTTSQPDHLHNLTYVQSTCRASSLSVVTLARQNQTGECDEVICAGWDVPRPHLRAH